MTTMNFKKIGTVLLLSATVLLTSCSAASSSTIVSSSNVGTSTSSELTSSEEEKKPSIEEEKKILKEIASSEESSSSESSLSSDTGSSTSAVQSSAKESSKVSAKESSKSSTAKAPASSKTPASSKAPSASKSPAKPSPAHVKTPVASGKEVLSGNGAIIDVSNASSGYIMAKCSGVSERLKFQVKTSKMTYNYDLKNNGSYEVFPLQMGNGEYTLRVMKNVSGSSYTQLFAGSKSVNLSSSLNPYLYPNQYVNFSSSSACVSKASNICAGCSTDIEKLKAIYNWMINNIKYDYAKASSVKTGYLPNVDQVLSSQKGICFDYASLMAAMLRSQGIPTQLVVGSAGAVAQNHAWNEVYLKGTGWITVKIQNTSSGWKLLDPTFGDKTGNTSAYAGARKY